MSNHDLLLVIDLQNVYTEGQPWACCHIRQAARNIRRLLDAGVCGEVLFTRFVPPAQPEGMWREYNRVNAAVNADAFANAMLPEMAPYLERYPLLDKSVYSSFSIPKVREAAARADRVVVTGVVAECCVLSTVLAGIDLGHRMVYLTDAVAGSPFQHELILGLRYFAFVEAIVSYLTVPHTEVLTTGAYLEQSR